MAARFGVEQELETPRGAGEEQSIAELETDECEKSGLLSNEVTEHRTFR